jgi:hypothetical protein
VISDRLGSADEAGPDRSHTRSPIVVCLADTDGSDGRALVGELAKARIRCSTAQLHPILSYGLQAAMHSPNRPRGPSEV